MQDRQDEGLGYSPATGPSQAATTIHTGTKGLDARMVAIAAGDWHLPAYVAAPAGRTGAPLILVISEAFGLHEHIADIARRFAHAGYFAVAPDLMIRQGDPMAYDDIGKLVSDLLLKIPDDQVLRDLDATVDWARANGASDDRLTATGFCWGGRWTWLYAAHRAFDAAVAWYGIVDGARSFPAGPARFPRHPLDLVDELQTPTLGLYGRDDDAIPVATVETMRARLQDGSAPARASEIVVYDDAGHAFFADYRDSYRQGPAEDAWSRCLAWIGERTRR